VGGHDGVSLAGVGQGLLGLLDRLFGGHLRQFGGGFGGRLRGDVLDRSRCLLGHLVSSLGENSGRLRASHGWEWGHADLLQALRWSQVDPGAELAPQAVADAGHGLLAAELQQGAELVAFHPQGPHVALGVPGAQAVVQLDGRRVRRVEVVHDLLQVGAAELVAVEGPGVQQVRLAQDAGAAGLGGVLLCEGGQVLKPAGLQARDLLGRGQSHELAGPGRQVDVGPGVGCGHVAGLGPEGDHGRAPGHVLGHALGGQGLRGGVDAVGHGGLLKYRRPLVTGPSWAVGSGTGVLPLGAPGTPARAPRWASGCINRRSRGRLPLGRADIACPCTDPSQPGLLPRRRSGRRGLSR